MKRIDSYIGQSILTFKTIYIYIHNKRNRFINMKKVDLLQSSMYVLDSRKQNIKRERKEKEKRNDKTKQKKKIEKYFTIIIFRK